MKKLMIAAAIVCAAAFAQAATVGWSSLGAQIDGTFDDGDGNYASNFAVYLFNNAGDYSQSQMLSLIQSDTWQTAFEAYGEGKDKYYYIGSTVADADGAFSPAAALVADGDFDGYLVIFDAAAPKDATYAFVSGIYSATDNDVHSMDLDFDGDTWIDARDYSIAGEAGSNWTAVNVPEPTTGLLMLFGLAGLALRRRRA